MNLLDKLQIPYISWKMFFENYWELENFLIKNRLKLDYFQDKDWRYFIEFWQQQIESFMQNFLNDLEFSNQRDFFDFINNILDQKSKPIWFFWDIISDISYRENEFLDKNNFEKILKNLKKWIGFLFDIDFERNFEKNFENDQTKKEIINLYNIVKQIFWNYFYVFLINTWIYDTHCLKNIVLVPKNVSCYMVDFNKYLKLHKKAEYID